MAISKKTRQQVYDKFSGLCAYTGKPLADDWQVDHVCPKCHYKWHQPSIMGTCDDIDNLIPALRIINHYKRSFDLEAFRKAMLTFHERLKKLPKKTSVPKTVRRIEYMNEIANHFSITIDKPFSGIFYFETINHG